MRKSRDDDNVPLNTLMADGHGNLYRYNGDSWWVNGETVSGDLHTIGELHEAESSDVEANKRKIWWW